MGRPWSTLPTSGVLSASIRTTPTPHQTTTDVALCGHQHGGFLERKIPGGSLLTCGTIAGVLRICAGAVLSATLASSPAPGRRISTGWPAAAAEQAAQPCPAASPPRALAPALPHAAAAAAEAAAAVAPRSAPRRDPGREVLLLKRAAPAALVERKPPEPKAPAPAQLAAPPWLGELSQRAVLGSGAACAAASPPHRSRSPSAAMRAGGHRAG